jgi:hypothetical protein
MRRLRLLFSFVAAVLLVAGGFVAVKALAPNLLATLEARPLLPEAVASAGLSLVIPLSLLLLGAALLWRDALSLLLSLAWADRPWRWSGYVRGFSTLALPTAHPVGAVRLALTGAIPVAFLVVAAATTWQLRAEDLVVPTGATLVGLVLGGLVRNVRLRARERFEAPVLELGRMPYRPGERFEALMRFPGSVPGTAEIEAAIVLVGSDGQPVHRSDFTLPRDFVHQTPALSTVTIKATLPQLPPGQTDVTWRLDLAATSRDRNFAASFVLPVHDAPPRLVQRNEAFAQR